MKCCGARSEDVADGVQIGVAQEFVSRAVKLVGPGAQRGIDHAAAHAAILGAEVAGDDFELGEGVGRRLHDLTGVVLVAGSVRVVVQAIEQEVVIGAAHAVDVERAFAGSCAGRKAERLGRDVDVGREQREVRVIAAIQRQFDNLLRGDNLIVLARIGFENRGHVGDGHGLGDFAELHFEVDALAGFDLDVDVWKWIPLRIRQLRR